MPTNSGGVVLLRITRARWHKNISQSIVRLADGFESQNKGAFGKIRDLNPRCPIASFSRDERRCPGNGQRHFNRKCAVWTCNKKGLTAALFHRRAFHGRLPVRHKARDHKHRRQRTAAWTDRGSNPGRAALGRRNGIHASRTACSQGGLVLTSTHGNNKRKRRPNNAEHSSNGRRDRHAKR